MGRYDHSQHSGFSVTARVTLCVVLALFFLLAPAASPGEDTRAAPSSVWYLTLDGPIGPALGDWFVRSLDDAVGAQADVFVLQINTPGGLDMAMREMIAAILDSPVPVVTYVAPSGSRAASAGTYILYASHIAAMAPATNLGAATPVQIGGDGLPGSDDQADKRNQNEDKESRDKVMANPEAMRHKQVNDAVAYIRGLAELRQRNADWAELAVREAKSLSASEALEIGVIEILAKDRAALLQQLDGQPYWQEGEQYTLNLNNPQLTEVERDWRTNFLAIITNPSIAYILLMVGIYGLILEFSNPGALVPGVLGGICLLVALYALQMLPLSYAGLALIFLGLALMVAEAFSPSFGALGLGGAVAFVVGSIMLIDTDVPAFRVAWPLVAAMGVTALFSVVVTVRLALKARRGQQVTGDAAMVGREGIALADFDQQGQVRIQGEVWRAHSPAPLHKGDPVRVTGREGLRLSVQPIAKEKDDV